MPVIWNDTDVIKLAEFLRANPKLMEMLDEKQPDLSTHNTSVEEMAMKGARVGGYQEAIRDIKYLSTLESITTHQDDTNQ